MQTFSRPVGNIARKPVAAAYRNRRMIENASTKTVESYSLASFAMLAALGATLGVVAQIMF